ncbi:DUF3025 domain-containing protein [Undibacterium sp.]|uniref:DUF3025 domain-containing protein n=1 Tax=Undibacterium sp. TaxID=1914977 RepID=UPI00374D9B73
MFYDGITWQQRWYAPVLPVASRVIVADDWRAQINAEAASLSMQNHRQQRIRFVEQQALSEGAAYEAFISDTGQVPTRENLHDFFNALVWLSFPRIKAQLNALQAAQIASLGIGKSRGAARDAATIFDENAALLVVADSEEGASLIGALRSHQWRQAFIEQRSLFGTHCEVWAFGHALMEKLVQPYKAITAHAWVVSVGQEYFGLEEHARRDHVDRLVAQQLASHSLTTADYTPLPVLGIPGWWPQQDEAFYADTQVFRPRRVVKDESAGT